MNKDFLPTAAGKCASRKTEIEDVPVHAEALLRGASRVMKKVVEEAESAANAEKTNE